MTPRAPRPPGGITNLARLGDLRAVDLLATPPPAELLPPVQSWRASPNGPVPLTRADRVTPSSGRNVASVDSAPARLHSAVSAAAVPIVTSGRGGGAAAAAAAVAFEGRPSTAERLPTVASPPPRLRRETARVVLHTGSSWRPVVVALAAALLLVAGVVHFAFVPLDVLVVWREPAVLTITSEPAGAVAKLDGTTVGATPAQATVRRDRVDHVLQLGAPGYREARQLLRYDAAVTLAARVRLDKESTPTFEQMPPRGAPAASPSAPPTAKTDVAKVAETKAGKVAKAASKTGKIAARERAAKKKAARARLVAKRH
jgi:hypothetical protein